MGKKRNKRNSKKAHVKHEAFKNLIISPIEAHHRDRGKLIPPAAKLGMEHISWRDKGLNEVLWAAILRGNMDQDSCIHLFHEVMVNSINNITNRKDTFITHSALSALSEDQFDIWIQPLLNHERPIYLLSSLLLLDCIPDRKHWERHLNAPDPEAHPDYLVNGIARCLDHRSEESTDIRWFKIAYATFVGERICFGEKQRDLIEIIRLYPNYGDQRSIRQRIRALEIAFRGNLESVQVPNEIPEAIREKVPDPWHDKFWKECYEKTPCLPAEPEANSNEDLDHYLDQFQYVYSELSGFFYETLEDTNINPKHDAAFGIVLYCLVLGMEASRGDIHHRVEGRLLLRTAVESFITLKYLVCKETPAIWEQFRNYGTGQSKLAFLKNLRDVNLPDFVSLDDLQKYANEDMWQEFTNINHCTGQKK